MAISLLLEALNQVNRDVRNSGRADFAIRNRRVVKIQYLDTIGMSKLERKHLPRGHNPKGTRTIYPYAYGLSKAGNPVLRAFQINDNSRRGTPKWKLFRLDRIVSWKVSKRTFDFEPKMFLEPNAPDFNSTGDRSMSTVFSIVQLPNMNSPLEREKAKGENMKNIMKVGTTHNDTSPIIGNAGAQRKRNVFTSQPNSQKYAQYAKNVETSQTDKLDKWADYDKAEAELNSTSKPLGKTASKPVSMDSKPLKTSTTKKFEDEDDWDEWLTQSHNNDF